MKSWYQWQLLWWHTLLVNSSVTRWSLDDSSTDESSTSNVYIFEGHTSGWSAGAGSRFVVWDTSWCSPGSGRIGGARSWGTSERARGVLGDSFVAVVSAGHVGRYINVPSWYGSDLGPLQPNHDWAFPWPSLPRPLPMVVCPGDA